MEQRKHSALYAGLLAVALGILIMLPAMIKFNGMFFIRGDYTNQTITRLITARTLLSGGRSPLWNWTNFLGSSYTGAYSILLSFNAVCMLFPAQLMPYASMLAICIRWFVMGLTCCLFLKLFVKERRTQIVGSLLYCFSGYAMACLEFTAFYNTMAVFPLLLLAVEKRFTDENYKYLLIPAVVLNLIASSYLFIGSSIALFIYALARFLTAEEWKKRRRFSYIALCFAEYFIGVLICGFTAMNFLGSMLTTSRSTASLASNEVARGSAALLLIPKYFFDELAGIFLPAASNRVTTFFSYTKWFSMQAYLPVFGFALCFAHILRKGLKDSVNIAMLAMLIFSFIPLLNNSTSFYANGYTRWWYALTLVFIAASLRVFEELESEDGDIDLLNRQARGGLALQWAAVILIPAGYFLVYLLRNTEVSFLKSVIAVFFNHDYSCGFAEDIFRIFSLGFAVVFTAALTAILLSKKVRRRALPIVAVLIALYGMGFVALNNSDAPVFDRLLNGIEPGSEARRDLKTVVDKYYVEDKPVNDGPYSYRVDHSNDVINYAAVINQPSISYFESTIDTDAAKFAVFAGMGSETAVMYAPKDDNNALRTLLSVRYYYDVFDDGKPGEIPQGFNYAFDLSGVKVYENENFIPFGFAYDSYITESELYSIEGAGVELLLHTLVVSDGEEAEIKKFIPHCTDLTPELASDVEARRRVSSLSFEGDSEGFSAEFSAEQQEVIFFSVPYAEGWTARIDGEKTEYYHAGIGFMAMVLPAGEHTVTFTYRSGTILPGIICTCFGIFAAVCYVTVSELVKKKRRSNNSDINCGSAA